MKCPFLKHTTIIHSLVQNTTIMGTERDRTETREEFFSLCLGKECVAYTEDLFFPSHCRRLHQLQ